MRLPAPGFARWKRRSVAIQAPLIPPEANAGSRFKVELLENVLDVLLNRARAAFQNLPDFVVPLSGDDPFDDLKFALGQVGRLFLGYAKAVRLAFTASFPGGHEAHLLPKGAAASIRATAYSARFISRRPARAVAR
jgi:hypothetical protein